MRPLVVTGASGQLGHAFTKLLGLGAVYVDRSSLDLTSPDDIGPVIRTIDPSVVINCAAYTAVDAAESDRTTAHLVNALAVEELARVCRDVDARLVTYSTDYVFDGTKQGPYVESDPTDPINVYGATKLEGEERALAALPSTLVIRTSWVMSGTHRSFASVMLELIGRGDVSVVDDQFGCPTFVDDLAAATLEAIAVDAAGIVHITNTGVASWYEVARAIAEAAGFDVARVHPCTTADYPTAAARPANSVLGSERRGPLGLAPIRDYHAALVEVVEELRR